MGFHGLLTALVTPFRDGALDEAAFRRLVRRQLDAGVEGLVPCGTTGEAPTLSHTEQLQVIRWTLEEAGGQVPVLAGIGSNCTASAIAAGQAAAALGVRGVLATAPYYNKPTQEGLFRHFQAIAQALPQTEVCLYDVPGRSAVRIFPETVERLAALPNVTSLKDATGDLIHGAEVLRRCGEAITVLSGDDLTALPLIAIGGAGCISVASNIIPGPMRALIDAARQGDLPQARALHLRWLPFFSALFYETNPLPAKAALAAMGLLQDELRLPLCPMAPDPRQRLLTVMQDLGVHPH